MIGQRERGRGYALCWGGRHVCGCVSHVDLGQGVFFDIGNPCRGCGGVTYGNDSYHTLYTSFKCWGGIWAGVWGYAYRDNWGQVLTSFFRRVGQARGIYGYTRGRYGQGNQSGLPHAMVTFNYWGLGRER